MTNIRVLPQPLPEDELKLSTLEAVDHTNEPIRFPIGMPEYEPIGEPLEAIRTELMRHGERLAGLLADPGTTFVRDALRVLENQICRIAVIGQVKSGQSTFIGALIDKTDILPAEVSPWSTAVMRLHFGWAGAPQGQAAEIQLFEGVDWHRLAAGAGRIRELTNQLVPGFETELLSRHLDAMRQRAEQRLGARFHESLGAKHSFETISSDVLGRYLCAGASATATEGPGQFADITKSVDLYFPAGPFRFPVTLIATPGINDPFLVRDEITRHSIDAADLYVMVLSARQPLTTPELSLLRMLREMHRDRLIVFIDHVDELRDPAVEARNLIAQVRQTLAREFATAEIPVVAGSARWAARALSQDDLRGREVLTPPLLAYAKHKGALRGVEIKQESAGASDEAAPSQVARVLAVCSGFPELRKALTGLLLRSHSAHLIRQIASYFSELAQINEGAAREDMVKHAIVAESEQDQRADSERELQHVQSELVRIQAVASELERKLAGLQKHMADVVAHQRSGLFDALSRVLETFARREGDGLLGAFADGRARRNWRCQTQALREEMQGELDRLQQDAAARLVATDCNVFPALRDAMLRLFPDMELPETGHGDGDPAMIAAAPSVPVEDSITFDLGASAGLMGWSRSRSPAEHANELERLITAEFLPAVDETVRLSVGALQRQAGFITDRATAISVAVIEALRKQSEGYIARAKELLDARETLPLAGDAHTDRLAHLRERLAVAEALSRRLTDLNTRCSQAIV